MKSVKQRICFLAVLCLAGGAFVLPYPAEDILGGETFEELRATGRLRLTAFRPDDSRLTLLPASELSAKISDFWSSPADRPTLAGENLYLLPRGDLNIDGLSVLLRSVSLMEGMQYYSASRGERTTLYTEAYCIAGPTDRTRVPDNTQGSADGVVQYCLMNDSTLGKTNYRATYFQSANELLMNLTNTTPVYFGPFAGIKAGDMQTNVLLTICDDAVVVYMNVRANFLGLGLIENTATRSLLARLDAIYDWFLEKIDLDG